MTTYTKELQDEIERVTLKGNADKQTIRRLASIIFRMDQRIIALEGGEVAVQEQPAKPAPVQEQKKMGIKVVKQVETPPEEPTPVTPVSQEEK